MKLIRIGITHGDINGVGYEQLLKVMQDPEILEICTPIVFGSALIAQATTEKLGLEPIAFNVIDHPADALDGRVNLVAVCKEAEPELQFGQQTEQALQAEAQSLTAALKAYTNHEIDAMVTLPGHLDNDASSHALSDFIRRALEGQEETFDWFLSGEIRTLLLHHQDVSTALGEGLASEAFISHITSISRSLRQDFNLMRPRIAVVSDQSKLKDDIEALQEQNITVFGPFDAQQFCEGQWQKHYDASLFLGEEEYQQKILSAEDQDLSIGYVSGLPLVLTYPLTGICYAKAGTGETSETPLRQAIYTAIDILRSRVRYLHAIHNPLEKQWVPRGRDDFKLDLTKEE